MGPARPGPVTLPPNLDTRSARCVGGVLAARGAGRGGAYFGLGSVHWRRGRSPSPRSPSGAWSGRVPDPVLVPAARGLPCAGGPVPRNPSVSFVTCPGRWPGASEAQTRGQTWTAGGSGGQESPLGEQGCRGDGHPPRAVPSGAPRGRGWTGTFPILFSGSSVPTTAQGSLMGTHTINGRTPSCKARAGGGGGGVGGRAEAPLRDEPLGTTGVAESASGLLPTGLGQEAGVARLGGKRGYLVAVAGGGRGGISLSHDVDRSPWAAAIPSSPAAREVGSRGHPEAAKPGSRSGEGRGAGSGGSGPRAPASPASGQRAPAPRPCPARPVLCARRPACPTAPARQGRDAPSGGSPSRNDVSWKGPQVC